MASTPHGMCFAFAIEYLYLYPKNYIHMPVSKFVSSTIEERNRKTHSRDWLAREAFNGVLRLFITRASPLKSKSRRRALARLPSGRAIKTQTYTIIVTYRHRVVRRSLALLHRVSLLRTCRPLSSSNPRQAANVGQDTRGLMIVHRRRAARRRRCRLSRDHKTAGHTAHRIARPNAPHTRNTNWRVIARRSSYRRKKGEKNLPSPALAPYPRLLLRN